MDEKDFEILETLAQTKNITHAADLLYITQSALSKRIGALEQELGVTLMLRSRQGIRFTAEGEEVLYYTRNAASCLKQMRDAIKQNQEYISGTLHAGFSIHYAQYDLPEILMRYRTLYPQVDTHITTDQSRKVFLEIMNGNIDIAVVRGEYAWKEHKLLLSRENICAIYNNSYKGKSLNDIPYINRKTDSVLERQIAQWLRENNLHPERHGIYVDNISTCVEMVERGIGWAIVPEICLKNFSGQIQPLRFENGEPFVRSTYLLYTDLSLSLPQVKAFIDTIRN